MAKSGAQYRAAAQAIRHWIACGGLRPGSSIPSTRVLSLDLGFSHAAIARACNILIASGALQRTGYKMRVGAEHDNSPPIRGEVVVLFYNSSFGRTVGKALAKNGVRYQEMPLSWSRHPSLAPALKEVLATKPAGLIVQTFQPDPETELILQRLKIPFAICTDRRYRWEQSSARMDVLSAVELALTHLYELGHREMAHIAGRRMQLASVAFLDQGHEELEECYRLVCLKLKLRSSAARVWKAEVIEADSVRDAITAGRKRHPLVTGLLCEDEICRQAMLSFAVPDEFSLVAYGGTGTSSSARPHPLTHVALADPECLARWAATEITYQLEVRESRRPGVIPLRTRFVPELFVGNSTRAVPQRQVIRKSPPVIPLNLDPGQTWKKVYPLLEKDEPRIWRQIDLSVQANHSLTRHHGWLGAEPLEHFPPGLRLVHGVPFQVLDEEKNGGYAVITFASPHSRSARGKALSSEAQIPICSRVRALYFLHGCGHAQPIPFARYIMRYHGGDAIPVPVIPRGASARIAARRLGNAKPNIQDWWPHFEQMDFPQAYRATVFNPADPASYQRSIYSLEWINPRPEHEIEAIEVQVDPTAGPTLALIAVTALVES